MRVQATGQETGVGAVERPEARQAFRVPILLRRLVRSPAGLTGAAIIVVVLVTALFATQLAPHDPYKTRLAERWKAPAWMDGGKPDYLLGTDHMGRDILSRIIYGSRVSVIVGVSAVLLAGAVGVVLGLAAGYWGRLVDTLVGRLVDTFIAVPYLVMVIAITGMLEGGVLTLILVLGFTGWPTYARQVRAEVLTLREREYVEAARAAGSSHLRIIFRHILPNAFSTVIVLATLNVGVAVISESGLSFLGLGVQAPTITWGGMLADGRDYLGSAWWLGTFPGLAITVTVLGVVFLGDFLRDVLDPRTKD